MATLTSDYPAVNRFIHEAKIRRRDLTAEANGEDRNAGLLETRREVLRRTGRIVLPADKQQRMLEREGVRFDDRGRCDLEKFLWKPRRRTSSKPEDAKARAALYGR